MSFRWQQKVLFKHCDPAGIVFYPRYFEMISDCIEAFFTDALNLPFEELLKTAALPTVHFDTSFTAPSIHGDMLDIDVAPTRIGNSSVSILVKATCNSETRLRSVSTLVYTTTRGRPQPWPDSLRIPIAKMIGDAT